ncbi:hypothetical protein SDRG_08638 [Saprolegnia diclina VS20]|uniref:Uncharacterized protein n=1 Tax=Saprolegnia diclina (strain VS20) TaxID=1156394 RepID=T0Q7Z3_SAPDV|nr:hypothetical protein SDRG_08638 [Saprolegnia diclina VS20]EQC33959.1 hypothetical protein SDRG_08638 [Saprolegnia diclina VS20]|eukprot:XP_008612754.1 hypothetical protein SDRG_08638 [Saprolegnia diclina VS20]
MAATFTSTILGQPEIASIVFGLQFGIYEDVRPAFRACSELVEFVAEPDNEEYECDVSFPQAFAPNAEWPYNHGTFDPQKYALHCHERDDRFPLHMAIAVGCLELTKRILQCRPDLASEDAIRLALGENRLEIADFLLARRATLPQLYRRVNYDAADVSRGPSVMTSELLAQADSRGVELLRRFGLPRDDDFYHDIVHAVYDATLENTTLALDAFPWLHCPAILNAVAARGFLPLVQSLHERGVNGSVNAMDNAATNGHLPVVRFLHEHRTEGCTTKALSGAISNGHLDVVRFLIEHRSEGASRNILDRAAANGHLDVVKYLHSLGTFGCTVAAVDQAAFGGHRNVVAFLLTHRSEGCSRNGVVEKALNGGHLRTAEYLLSLGFPFPSGEVDFDPRIYDKAEMMGLFRLVMDHGQPWREAWVENACTKNNVPLVTFLLKHRDARACPGALATAIVAQAMDVVRYLLANCTTHVSPVALLWALGPGSRDLLSQMLRRHPELRNDELLRRASSYFSTEAMRYLLPAGIGKPRECLVEVAGRRRHVTASKLLLPYCMKATNHLDNVIFLLELLALPDICRATTLRLITPELTQGLSPRRRERLLRVLKREQQAHRVPVLGDVVRKAKGSSPATPKAELRIHKVLQSRESRTPVVAPSSCNQYQQDLEDEDARVHAHEAFTLQERKARQRSYSSALIEQMHAKLQLQDADAVDNRLYAEHLAWEGVQTDVYEKAKADAERKATTEVHAAHRATADQAKRWQAVQDLLQRFNDRMLLLPPAEARRTFDDASRELHRVCASVFASKHKDEWLAVEHCLARKLPRILHEIQMNEEQELQAAELAAAKATQVRLVKESQRSQIERRATLRRDRRHEEVVGFACYCAQDKATLDAHVAAVQETRQARQQQHQAALRAQILARDELRTLDRPFQRRPKGPVAKRETSRPPFWVDPEGPLSPPTPAVKHSFPAKTDHFGRKKCSWYD